NAAAELAGHGTGLEDRLNRRGVHGFAREGAVQIDKVDPFRTRIDKGTRLGGGIVVEDGGLVHLAMHKAHGLPVFKVDGGIEDHGVLGVKSPVQITAFLGHGKPIGRTERANLPCGLSLSKGRYRNCHEMPGALVAPSRKSADMSPRNKGFAIWLAIITAVILA